MSNKLEDLERENLEYIEASRDWFNNFLCWVYKLVTESNRNSFILSVLALEYGGEITISQKTLEMVNKDIQEGNECYITTSISIPERKIVLKLERKHKNENSSNWE